MNVLLYIILICVSIVIFYVFYKTTPFIRNTYFFWLVSLGILNSTLFFFFIFPPAFILVLGFAGKFLPFLTIPFAISVGAVFVFAAMCHLVPRLHGISEGRFTIICNALFLGMFLISGEYYKDILIEKALVGHNPDCINVMPFIISLREIDRDVNYSRGTHAVFTENGKTYIWSYALKSFSEVDKAPSIGFPCRNNRKLLPSGSLVVDG